MKEMNLMELENVNGGDTTSCLGYTGAALGAAAGAITGLAAGGPIGAIVGLISAGSATAFSGAAATSCPAISGSTSLQLLGAGGTFQPGIMLGGFNQPKF